MSAPRPRPQAPLLALLLAAGLLAPAARAGGGIKLSGWVWGMKPGDAVTLTIEGPVKRQINARPGGAWSIDGLPSGEYKVVPSSPGYRFQPPVRSARPGTGGLNSINFRATPPAAAAGAADGFKIRGRVRGLPASERVLVRAEGPTRAEVMTRPGGQYVLAGLAPGTYRVEVADERWTSNPAGRNVEIKRADRTNIHFTAKRRGRTAGYRPELKVPPKPVGGYLVVGHVDGLKATLHGCISAAVVAEGKDQTLRTKTKQSEDVRVCGRFIFRDVPSGVYRLTVHVTGDPFLRYESSPSSRKINVQSDVHGINFEVNGKPLRTQTPGRRRR